MIKKNNLMTIAQSKRTWLIASTVFVSTGIAEIDARHRVTAAADDLSISQPVKSQNEQFSPTKAADGKNQVENNASSVVSEPKNQQVSDAVASTASASVDSLAVRAGEQDKQPSQVATLDGEAKNSQKPAKVLPLDGDNNQPTSDDVAKALTDAHQADQTPLPQSDIPLTDEDKAHLADVAREILDTVKDDLAKKPYSTNPNNDPLKPLYEMTKTSSYEELVNVLGGFLPNLAYPGEGQLDYNQEYVKKPGEMKFDVPSYSFFGYGGKENDYSNVSYMRLITDETLVRDVADRILSIMGTPYKGTKTNYTPENNSLSFSGGFPFYAVIQSTNGSLLNPTYYLGQLSRTLEAITNLLTFGAIDTTVNQSYDSGQYGIYLRLEVPEGTDPNTVIQAMNLDKSKFGAQMDFNVNLSVDEILNRIPGIRDIISSSAGIPISGYAGSVIDLLMGSVLDKINEEYGTNLKAKGVDSPFYPITLYPKDIKTNLKEDPRGMYLLVRGDNLDKFDSLFLQAKIMLTKFFMNALSWGGNIVGGAYGYLNFDLNRYQGNMSSEEMAAAYGKDSANSKAMAGYADDSPNKVLTKGQIPPNPDGRLSLSMNALDANSMLSEKKEKYANGNLGKDIVIDRNKIHDNPQLTGDLNTWRAYISLFDNQGEYNTKNIDSSKAEWTEVDGVKQVLPGSDIDHRTVELKPGEDFYAERDRFDRVIDYFTGDVLLDENGFHETDAVKSLKLVKSVDPEGKKTSADDFAIYDRPFTVYYNGEMTLADGRRIALRPTKMTVIQHAVATRSAEDGVDLNRKRTIAYNHIKEQADFIKLTVQDLTPKVADEKVVDFIHRIDDVLVSANQALEKAQSEEDVFVAQDAAVKNMQEIQKSVITRQDLDAAMRRAARQQGDQQINDTAYSYRLMITDAKDLDDKQKADYVKAIQDIQDETLKNLSAIYLHAEEESAKQSLQDYLNQIGQETNQGLNKIRNLYLSQEEKDKAITELKDTADDRLGEFKKVDFVDPESLAEQSAKVHALVSDYTHSIDESKTYDQLVAVKEEGITAIKNVALPVRNNDYDEATAADKAAARQTLANALQLKKEKFAAIEHVDKDSLNRQDARLDAVVDVANQSIDSAKTKGEVKSALRYGLATLDTVAEPELELAYQPVSDIDRQNARDAIDSSAKNRLNAMKKIEHVDANSLKEQSNLLAMIVNDAMAEINAAQNKQALRDALTNGLSKIESLADPKKEAPYQKPTVADREEAKKAMEQAGEDKKRFFEEIDGVDPDSLKETEQSVDRIVSEANTAIDQADTLADVDKAYRDGLKELDNLPMPKVIFENEKATDEDRQHASDKLHQVATNKQDSFNQIEHVDQNSLKQQSQLIERNLSSGLESFKSAVTKGNLAKALQQAIASIENIAAPSLEDDYQPATSDDKLSAQKKLEEASEKRKKEMAAIKNVDPKSLVNQQKIVGQVLMDYLGQLTSASLRKDVATLLDNGLKTIQAVADPVVGEDFQPASTEKKASAKRQLEQAKQEKERIFNSIEHVDPTSLKNQTHQLEVIAESGYQAIDEAQTNGDVNRELNEHLLSISQVLDPMVLPEYQPANEMVKNLAKQTLTTAKEGRENTFKNIGHVDQSDLGRRVSELEEALASALSGLDRAKMNGQVKQVLSDGLQAISAILEPDVETDYQPVTDQDRNETVALVERASDHKQKDFEQIAHVDQKSLQQQKEAVINQLSWAKSAIQQAGVQAELRKAVQEGLSRIASVADPVLEKAYQPAKPESKDQAKKQLDEAADKKKKDFSDIDGVNPDSEKKQDKAVDDAVKKGKKSIDQAEKEGEVDDAFRKALSDIDAVSNPEIQEERKTATNQDRQNAKKVLSGRAEEIKKAFASIEHVDQLSLNEQQNLVERERAVGETAIDGDKTKGNVQTILQDSLDKMNQISQPSLEAAFQPASLDDKKRATALLYQAADQRIKRFEAIEHVDPVSLKKQTEEVRTIEGKAADDIQASATRGSVDQTLTSAIQSINAVKEPALSAGFEPITPEDKRAATSQVVVAGRTKKEEFTLIPYVDQGSLKQQMDRVDAIVDKATEDINNANTKSELDGLISKAIMDISQVPAPKAKPADQPASQEMKDIYKAMLQRYADEKKQKFEAIEHVSQVSLKEELDIMQDILTKGQNAIQKADTNWFVIFQYRQYIGLIDTVPTPELEYDYQTPTSLDIKAATNRLTWDGDNRKYIFNHMARVNPDSLAQRKAEVDQLVKERIPLFSQAKTHLELNAIVNKAVQDLYNIPFPDVLPKDDHPSKEEIAMAISSLEKAAENKRADFESIVHVDAQSLDRQIKLLTETLRKQKSIIQDSQTQSDLQKNLVDALSAIQAVARPDVEDGYQSLTDAEKEQAVSELEKLVSERTDEFEQLLGVDPDSLAKQKQLLQDTFGRVKTTIMALVQRQELAPAMKVARAEIMAVEKPALSRDYQTPSQQDRDQAIEQLKRVAETKKSDFDNIIGTQSDSLAAQKLEVDQTVVLYQEKIAGAQTIAGLNQVLLAGEEAINAVESPKLDRDHRPATAQDLAEAKAAVQQAGDEKKQSFDKIDHVDPESLERQKQKVDKIINDNLSALDASKTLGELTRVKNVIIFVIQAVDDPDRLPVVNDDKEKVKAEVAEAAKEKKAAIDAVPNANAGERDEIEKDLATIVEDADAKIDAADTHDKIDAAVQEALDKIAQLPLPKSGDNPSGGGGDNDNGGGGDNPDNRGGNDDGNGGDHSGGSDADADAARRAAEDAERAKREAELAALEAMKKRGGADSSAASPATAKQDNVSGNRAMVALSAMAAATFGFVKTKKRKQK